MNVKLLCKTLGYKFGAVITVGSEYKDLEGKKFKVSKKQIDDLVASKMAVEVPTVVMADAKGLKAELVIANKSIDTLETEVAGKDAKIIELEAKIVELEATVAGNK